jgi:mRNA interferase MazF
MVARNEIYWADVGADAGRRPVCVLTRTAATGVLHAITIAPITRTIRGIASEVLLGPEHGLPERCVINCDTITSIPTSVLADKPISTLDLIKRLELDQAIRYALDIAF